MIEDRSMSVKYCLLVPVFHFWRKTNAPCSAVSLRQLSILSYYVWSLLPCRLNQQDCTTTQNHITKVRPTMRQCTVVTMTSCRPFQRP